jgi:hypothetical protein
MRGRKYEYRALKSTWGIRICLTAEAVRAAGPTPQASHVMSNIWLSDQTGSRGIADDEMRMLADGIRLLGGEIGETEHGRPIVITIRDLHYVESDFQLEGLTAAMIGWAVDEFSLTPRDIEVSFDRRTNRYSFAWSKGDRPSAG